MQQPLSLQGFTCDLSISPAEEAVTAVIKSEVLLYAQRDPGVNNDCNQIETSRISALQRPQTLQSVVPRNATCFL
jgi:hypothetical protein